MFTQLGVAPFSSPSASPFPRYGLATPTVTTAGGELYMFGGLVEGSIMNDLHTLDCNDLSAKYIQTRGDIPSPRLGHAVAIISELLIVWGGNTNAGRPAGALTTRDLDNGLYVLNLGEHHDPASATYVNLNVRSLQSMVKYHDTPICPYRTSWTHCGYVWS
jgi:hypothetical protein